MEKIINYFENTINYKLYRTIPEILHPTISKKNISNYKIVLDDDIENIRVYYPDKVTHISNIFIFVHGEDNNCHRKVKYGDISRMFSDKLDCLVISVDYCNDKDLDFLINNIYLTISYIIDKLIKLNIVNLNLNICGDSIGASIVLKIGGMISDKYKSVKFKQILFYPMITYKEADFNFDDSDYSTNPILFVVGSADYLYGDIKKLYSKVKKTNKETKLLEVEFLSHSFLMNLSVDDKKNIFDGIVNFIK